MSWKLFCLIAVGNWLLLSTVVINARAQEKPDSTTKPVPVDFEWWRERHQSFNNRAAQGNVDLIFIGDSITQGWESDGKTVWQKCYAPRNAMNLGINGDRTQNVLWRLDHGNLEGIKPKLAVVMIGTNNSHAEYSNEDIAAGITAIVNKLREKLPDTKVLLLAIFPRNRPVAGSEKIAVVNRLVAPLADDKMVYFLDIGPKFLEDGKFSRTIMPDWLHLSRKGYEIWAASIEDKVAELMGEKKPS